MQPFKAGMGSEEGLRRVGLVFVLSLATWVVARAAYNDLAFAVWVACLAWLAFLWLIDARQRSLEDRG
jgi:hypothetical protein